MALSRDEIELIARCKANCVLAGITFGFNREAYMQNSPTMTPRNVAGLVDEKDLVVPSSELAMHEGAAGKKLIAWALRGDSGWAQIVYEDETACCGFTDGHPAEVLTPKLLQVTEGVLHIASSGGQGHAPPAGKLPTRGMVRVEVWEERDRLHIGIQDKETGVYYASWWDDEARQMFEDGFFKRGAGLQESVLEYAEDVGILAK